jgi:hypothetical protein
MPYFPQLSHEAGNMGDGDKLASCIKLPEDGILLHPDIRKCLGLLTDFLGLGFVRPICEIIVKKWQSAPRQLLSLGIDLLDVGHEK